MNSSKANTDSSSGRTAAMANSHITTATTHSTVAAPKGKAAVWRGFVQYFYLGKTAGGIITILLSLVTCYTVWPLITLIQGIMMLCMSNEEFRRKYVTTTSSFPLF